MGLCEDIEAAWKNGTNKSWASKFPGISEGSIQYGQVSEVTIHYNNCKSGCNGKCITSAEYLVNERLKNIQKGMPDLPYEEERDVWYIAFELHREHSSSSVISPSWTDYPNRCRCFERAQVVYRERSISKQLQNTPVDPDDFHFEPRFD